MTVPNVFDSPLYPVLVALDGQGFRFRLLPDGVVQVKPIGKLPPDVRAIFHQYPAELKLLVRCLDAGVLVRLDGMRRTVGKVPIPCAVLEACGGPGRCFSCGDALSHSQSYGRCGPCDIACELFYRECPDAADRWQKARLGRHRSHAKEKPA